MLEIECGCEQTYEQPKLFDPDHLLVICVDCGEVLEEVLTPFARYQRETGRLSPDPQV